MKGARFRREEIGVRNERGKPASGGAVVGLERMIGVSSFCLCYSRESGNPEGGGDGACLSESGFVGLWDFQDSQPARIGRNEILRIQPILQIMILTRAAAFWIPAFAGMAGREIGNDGG